MSKPIKLGLSALIVVAVVLTACSSEPPSWPGMTVAGATEERDQELLIVANADGYVYALNLEDGSKEWQFPEKVQGGGFLGCSSPPAPGYPFYAAPAISGGLVFAGSASSHGLFALDAADGDQQWQFATHNQAEGLTLPIGNISLGQIPPAPIFAAPVVVGDTIYLASGDHKVYALDLEGEPVWDSPFQTGNWLWASPVPSPDGIRLFVASMDHHLYCVDAETGQELWSFEAGGSIPAAPAYADGVLYFGALDGKVYAVDAATRAPKWPAAFDAESWVWGTPLVVGDTVYVTALGGQVFALDAQTGVEKWDAPYEAGTRLRGSPAYYAGEDVDLVLVAGDDGILHALDARYGDELWAYEEADAAIRTTPFVVGDTVFIATVTTGKIYAVDATSGKGSVFFDPAQQ